MAVHLPQFPPSQRPERCRTVHASVLITSCALWVAFRWYHEVGEAAVITLVSAGLLQAWQSNSLVNDPQDRAGSTSITSHHVIPDGSLKGGGR